MTGKQKAYLIVLLIVAVTVAGRLFLNAPIAHIQLAAETVVPDVFGMWNITNSIIAAWVAMGVIVTIAFLATRKMKVVPTGLQNLVEAVVGGFYDFVVSIAGKENGRRFFPVLVTIFIFILVANWMSLLPVFGTIGKVEPAYEVLELELEEVVSNLNERLPAGAQEFEVHHLEVDGHSIPAKPEEQVLAAVRRSAAKEKLVIFDGTGTLKMIPVGFGIRKSIRMGDYWDFDAWEARSGVVPVGVGEDAGEVNLSGKTVGRLVPYLRNMNTDLMIPLAIAFIAMFMIEWWGIRANGFFNYLSRFINFKQGPIGFVVGILEAISEFSRLISFSFRLLGNMFAGEVLIFSMVFLLPIMAGVLVFPFLLELFVGFIQAVVFAALTLVFAVLAVTSHSDHGEEEHSPGH